MKKRLALLLLAVLLPLCVVIGAALIAMPGMLPSVSKNTTAFMERFDKKRKVPNSLEEAKKIAIDHLTHLQKITQTDWEKERQQVLYRHPPMELSRAMELTRLRISDLNQMSQADWEIEKKRLEKRNEYWASRDWKP